MVDLRSVGHSVIHFSKHVFQPFADIGDGEVDEIGVVAVIAAFRAIVDPHRGHAQFFRRA